MENSILLVEDEKKTADMLRLWLNENAFNVNVAYDGKSGLDLFKNQKFNFVLLDINLPDINGYEICKRIRHNNTEVPIIMLTALGSLDDKAEGYASGADDYLSKPFQFRELLMKINALMRRASSGHRIKNILKAGSLEMNLDTKTVTREGMAIGMTAKEFQLLEFLIRNKNKVISRNDIALSVWNVDFKTNTNIIDVYISYLRTKVDKNFPDKLIHTQLGMGFILKADN